MSNITTSKPVSQLVSPLSPARASNTTKRTSLLDLPAEIWSQIGRLVIDAAPQLDRAAVTTWSASKYGYPARQPALTRTCHILRQELLGYYYKTHVQVTIYAGLVSDPELGVGRWLRAIGHDNRMSLRGFQVASLELDTNAAATKATKQWGFAVDFAKMEEHQSDDGRSVAWYEVRFGLSIITTKTAAAMSTKTTATTTTTTRTSLLNLPAELWSKIGKLTIDATPTLTRAALAPGATRANHQQPPLTRTSRILREELLPYYYKTRIAVSTTIGNRKPTCSEIDTRRWLNTIGPENRKYLRDFRIKTFSSMWRRDEFYQLAFLKHWGFEVQIAKIEEGWHFGSGGPAKFDVRFV